MSGDNVKPDNNMIKKNIYINVLNLLIPIKLNKICERKYYKINHEIRNTKLFLKKKKKG